MPIEGVVLQMKGMHIDAVANFPFPTPPDRIALKRAETLLTHLGALDFPSTTGTGRSNALMSSAPRMTIGGHITDVGKAMSLFPVSPRFSKMLVAARKNDALPYVIAVVAALSVGNPFLHENYIQHTDGKDGENDVGLEDDEDAPAELAYIKNPELRAKELRKMERRKFFKSQQVRQMLYGVPRSRILINGFTEDSYAAGERRQRRIPNSLRCWSLRVCWRGDQVLCRTFRAAQGEHALLPQH